MTIDCTPAARSTNRSTEIGRLSKFKSINVSEQQQREPPVGIEPTTCSLRETRRPEPDVLAAQTARPNAHSAHNALVEHSTRSTTRSTTGQPGRPELVTVGSQRRHPLSPTAIRPAVAVSRNAPPG